MAQPRTPDERDIDTLTEIEQLAQDIGVTGTPSYAIGASGTDPAEFEHVPVTGGSPAVDQLRAAAEKVETKK
jgi:protein-disulfide isomerase